jgi:hypothetical protein
MTLCDVTAAVAVAAAMHPCSWSSISRRERYLKRCTEAGDELPVDAEHNLLPGEAGHMGGGCDSRVSTPTVHPTEQRPSVKGKSEY